MFNMFGIHHRVCTYLAGKDRVDLDIECIFGAVEDLEARSPDDGEERGGHLDGGHVNFVVLRVGGLDADMLTVDGSPGDVLTDLDAGLGVTVAVEDIDGDGAAVSELGASAERLTHHQFAFVGNGLWDGLQHNIVDSGSQHSGPWYNYNDLTLSQESVISL